MQKNLYKKALYLFVFFFALFITPNIVKADYMARYFSPGKCALQSSSTGSCLYNVNASGQPNFNSTLGVWLDTRDIVIVHEGVATVAAPKTGNGSECPTTYSYVSNVYSGKTFTGWACTSNIKVPEVSEELKEEFAKAGFPDSYWPSLALMREVHSDWKFVAIDTELDFQTAVNNMDSGSKSLVQTNQGLFSTASANYNWATDTFKAWDGSTWFAANNATIAYYMDPRNFLNDTYIFQFESLSYDENLQSLAGIQKLLGTAYIGKFAEHFLATAQTVGVNPIYLAALSKQEVGSGTTAGTAVSGLTFTCTNTGKTYSGLYNFYNIGATSSGTSCHSSVTRGLVYANGGEDGSAKTYSRPWKSEASAIKGGAEFIANSYIQYGQDTSYFKKWNVVYNYAKKKGISNPYANYTHQYMQNVRAPSAEAMTTVNAYKGMGILDSEFVFYIPVFKNMPALTVLPPNGNPNNRLKSISINDTTVTGFVQDTFSYTVHVENTVKQAKIAATKINANASIAGTGTFDLVVGENKFVLNVTAENGSKQAYNITIVRAIAPGDIIYPPIDQILTDAKITNDGTYISNLNLTTNVVDFKNKILAVAEYTEITINRGATALTTGTLRTGDTIIIKSGEETKTFTILIYGDINADGAITIADLLKVQKHLLGDSLLTGIYAKAADVNKDGVITIADLLRVQKHILGDSFITQI